MFYKHLYDLILISKEGFEVSRLPTWLWWELLNRMQRGETKYGDNL